ncbi:hypothetical protein NDU88_005230 [Pleurodeles waltl]|uniref:Uncharacterized protein n=1 Tax=Pleurodeles waltl TaxID=8319 RepID=A0AAV7LRK7_PLEWA|nr:hypothetical protein NDU88_005230 [Pleurodeles waltl]
MNHIAVFGLSQNTSYNLKANGSTLSLHAALGPGTLVSSATGILQLGQLRDDKHIPQAIQRRKHRSDPHTSATGVATAWEDPEVTPRSTLPIGSELYPRDPGDLKGEVPEFEGGADGRRGSFQEASEDPNQRLVRTQVKRRPLGSSGIPEDGARPERRTIAVPTWDEDRRPREANP